LEIEAPLRTKGPAKTREHLIDATERLICEGGLSGVTTQKVARECGFAEGTIYRHFSSLEDLIITALRERLPGEFQPHIDALVRRAGQGSIEENLRDFVDKLLPIYSIIAPTLGMLAANPALAARNAEAMRADGNGPSHLLDRISVYFREEQRLGRIPHDVDVRAASGTIVSFCFYHCLMQHLFGEDPTHLSDTELSNALARILGRGVAGKPGAPAEAHAASRL
jgi:AcrR family transcriptional regulator